MSTALFESGVSHYQKKFEDTVSKISGRSIETIAKSCGMSMDALQSGLQTNSEEFRRFCYAYSSTLMPGRVSCCTYAAVVASVAKKLGVPYKAYAGFCLQKNSARYEKDLADWEAKKAQGEEHPFFATHAYVEIDGVPYEYFNGDTTDISHLDVVQIAEG